MTFKISWTKLESTLRPCSRSSHGLSIVKGTGKLVLYGGEHVARTPLDDNEACWIYDLRSSTWKRVDTTTANTNVPPPRVAHAQAVHGNDVYIFGGRAGIVMNEQAMNDLWKFDTNNETFTLVTAHGGSPPEERSFHRMICVNDALYVFGGCGASHGRLADLHRFDIGTKTWQSLGTSSLRGRGGPNLLPIDNGTKLAVVGGFAGEETSDGQIFDLATQKWETNLLQNLQGLRPRSVCASASFPSLGVACIFGGEVDPSDRGHEGAGGFENDVVILDESTAAYRETIKAYQEPWPMARGWADSASVDDEKTAQWYIFGGLTGDDESPIRLDDLWRMDIEAES